MNDPAAQILDTLAKAHLDHRIDFTDVPPDYRPPRLTIEFETTGDVRAFVARVAELAAENERERVG